jgi:hypothetical protein
LHLVGLLFNFDAVSLRRVHIAIVAVQKQQCPVCVFELRVTVNNTKLLIISQQ